MTTRELPQSEQDLLKKLREEGNLPILRARVALLRDSGWTLAAIGAPLEANRSTARMWEYAAISDDYEKAKEVAPVPVFERAPKGARAIRKYPDVPADERESLRELANKARSVRGWTPDDAESRIAANELGQRLLTYDAKGVPLKRLAEHMGVTHRAVAARIERAQEKETTA